MLPRLKDIFTCHRDGLRSRKHGFYLCRLCLSSVVEAGRGSCIYKDSSCPILGRGKRCWWRCIARGGGGEEWREKEKVNFRCVVAVECLESDLLYTFLLKNGHSTAENSFNKSFIQASRAPYGNLLMQFQNKCRQSSALHGYASP